MSMLLKPASEIQILIVDDIADNLRLLAKILEAEDYIVRKTISGRMALQAAHHDPPDLILLDINMPELNGFEVCKRLRASAVTADIPVIFISALDQVQDKALAFELGGQDYITKPFQGLEVLARVKNQLLIQQQKHLLQQEIQTRQQAEAEARRLNADLERQVQARTLELQQALSFEVALKHISEQVRDSLDQNQIIQKAVETLAWALEVRRCDAALYSSDRSTSTIHYQWVQSDLKATQGKTLEVSDALEIHDQLQKRMSFAFCELQHSPFRYHNAILACPIFDDRVNETGILGYLWLFREIHSSYSDRELALVKQVATQCAIALRQARLYEAAQTQVQELERLNQLKDDFLSSISHELRSPIASIKTVLTLLSTVTDNGQNLALEISKSSNQTNKVAQYFQILQEECDRELALVEDLLNLQYMEAGSYVLQPTLIDLQELISYLVEPFESRTQNQQQMLQVNVPPELPSLNLDPKGISRVITELLSNAFKYTPAGGAISLSVSLTQAEALEGFVQDHSDGASPRCLQITVANTGTEIPMEELPRIFDKFYRIPNNDPWRHGGTGLGLALIKRLTEQMGGSIRVESSNHQTCFTVVLTIA